MDLNLPCQCYPLPSLLFDITCTMIPLTYSCSMLSLITPHAQRERGKVIGRGVHIYIHICDRAWEKGPCRANNDFSV